MMPNTEDSKKIKECDECRWFKTTDCPNQDKIQRGICLPVRRLEACERELGSETSLKHDAQRAVAVLTEERDQLFEKMLEYIKKAREKIKKYREWLKMSDEACPKCGEALDNITDTCEKCT
jgi:DNA repair ATPase RecN